MTRTTLAGLMLLILAACTGDRVSGPGDDTTARPVSIMTFNVENLFDNVDDRGRDDLTYLPLESKSAPAHVAACRRIEVERWRDECLRLDWSDAVIAAKLAAVAGAIRQVDGGADIISFQEVENVAILERLRNEHLADLGYAPAILIEGQDVRGIDVAFLARLPVAGEPVLHALSFDDYPEREGDTRGVLQVTFELPDGALLTGFAVHFPAPFHPTGMRASAYRHLNDLRRALPDDRHVFAAGDFNTTRTEDEETGLLDRFVRPDWSIAHEVALEPGCKHCFGTQYYAPGDSWSFLDMILWSPARGENATWRIRADSVQVLNDGVGQRQDDGTPKRFEPGSRTGVSDHWPLLMLIEPAIKQ